MGAGFAAPAASHVPNVAVARTGGTLERGGWIALRSTFDARFGIIGLNFGFCVMPDRVSDRVGARLGLRSVGSQIGFGLVPD